LSRIPAASLSLLPQAAKTSAAKLAIAVLSAACAQSIKSFGSFSSSAWSRHRPNSGHTNSWS
jgi:O-glycosyl hydrolase